MTDIENSRRGHSRTSSTSSFQSVYDNDFSDDNDDDQSFKKDEIDLKQDDISTVIKNDNFNVGDNEHDELTKVSVDDGEPKSDVCVELEKEHNSKPTHGDKESDSNGLDNIATNDGKEILICEDIVHDEHFYQHDQYGQVGISLDTEFDSPGFFDEMASLNFDDLAVFDWDIPIDEPLDDLENQLTCKRSASRHQTVIDRVIEALKVKKHTFPRIFHTRSNPGKEYSDDGSNKSLMKGINCSTPLAMISKIAKSARMDVTTLLESAEKMMQFKFPCMQCFEKSGHGGEGSSFGGGYDYYGQDSYQKTTDGRCTSCGGVVPTAASFRQMILKLRERLKEKKLLVYDVYPDGNCLFGAVIDQLRIRGDFRYTITSLRLAAVEYLRNNPTADDGTPYAMFLSGETWDSYLLRMSRDGQWGDHIVLSAIATELNCQLAIYGGVSGDGETIIDPKNDKAASDEGTVLIPNKVPTLYLGHLGESHYVSLRPEKWKESLQESINNKAENRHEQNIFAESLEDLSNKLLPLHCNSLLKSIFLLNYISSHSEDVIDVLAPGREENKQFVYEMMGKLINKVEPCVSEIESYMPEVDAYFPESSETKSTKNETYQKLIIFCTPNDSRVVFNVKNANRLDLICEHKNPDYFGEMRLVPSNKKFWKSILSDNDYLKTFKVGYGVVDSFPVLKDFYDIDVYPVIAFKCRWPDKAAEWISRQQTSGWLTDSAVSDIVTSGCHVIPVLAKEQLNEMTCTFQCADSIDGLSWVISFAAAEKRLFQMISVSQRHCFRFLQLYLSTIVQDTPLPDCIVQSIFLHAVENIEAVVWEQQPACCFHRMLQNLVLGLENEYIPHFFVSSKNILTCISKPVAHAVYNKVKSYCNQPFIGLYFFLDHYDITTSEIGPFLDSIVEDIFTNDQNRRPECFFFHVTLPSLASVLADSTTLGNYADATILVTHIKNEIHRFCGEEVPEATIICSALSKIHYGYFWCLALYMDLRNGTLITRDVHGERTTVNVREVFGPECTEELPDTLVDATFKVENGDLYFPIFVVTVLEKLGKDRAITKCVRYYLDTLNDLAGDNFVMRSCYHTENPLLASGQLMQLFNLYLKLHNAYLRQNCVKDSRDMMPTVERLADYIGTSSCYTQLKHIWTNLGEYEKAQEAGSKMKRMKTATSFPTMLQTLSSIIGSGGSLYYD